MKEVMENEADDLPRPSVKIIYVPSGEDPTWQGIQNYNGAGVDTTSNHQHGWR
jgi:hypothetical protein